jgi:hypothetical protein
MAGDDVIKEDSQRDSGVGREFPGWCWRTLSRQQYNLCNVAVIGVRFKPVLSLPNTVSTYSSINV